tara:strand:- start:2106 stop:2276 length:171 start_codon:yes stop_codon:yes gene_type:complete
MTESKTVKLTEDECRDLLKALKSWHDVVGCMDDDDQYDGLDWNRYQKMLKKLGSIV